MANPILTTQPSEKQTPIRVLPDIATVCPICKRGFNDADFAELVWTDPHTPIHQDCFNPTQTPTQT